MRPIRFASLSRTTRLGVGTMLVWASFLLGSVRADRLSPLGVDEFRALIDGKHYPRPNAEALADYRRSLLKAVAELPSLAEVSRVLLLSEWSAAEFDPVSPIPLDRIQEAVSETDDEAFIRAVRKLFALKPDDLSNRTNINRAILAKMRNEVRQQLLKHLEETTRAYLRGGRNIDRIAAANLISYTITTSHNQDVSQYEGVTGVMHSTDRDVTPSSKALRNRLRKLIGDVRKLTLDADPQVQVAAIRALSNMEKNGKALADSLKPLLTSTESNVVARRAAAAALGHMLEETTTQMDKTRPLPYLKNIEEVLPVAVLGLSDGDAEVRFASLMACQRAATILDDLANDPKATTDRRLVFRSAMDAVDRAQPAIGTVARESIPSLRVLACRVLESFVLVDQKVRPLNEKSLPVPVPESTPKPNKEGEKRIKGVSLPASRHGRSHAASGPSSWATARRQARDNTSPLPTPVILDLDETSTVTLERPIQLPVPNRASELKPVAFQAFQADDLPLPKTVAPGMEGILKTMIANLNDPDYRVRISAVEVLETLGERAESAIPELVKALRDPNKFVRWAAVRSLGRLNPRRASEVVPGLTSLLNDREDPSVRIAVAYALELYGPAAKQAVPHLARVINRGDKDYILAILHTIQGIGTDAVPALPNIAWVLRDREQATSVRVEAALVLGRFGVLAQKQLPTLREIMVRDPNEAVRNAASNAVLAIDKPLN